MKSDNAKKGLARAPHRSLFYAMGFIDEELERPLVGVCCAKNEIIPGHIELDRIAEAVKAGVRMAGGTPIEFPAIGVCDGIAMGHEGMKYSLVTRELIADSIECVAKAHQFDALVMIPNCDKIVPGMLMAAARHEKGGGRMTYIENIFLCMVSPLLVAALCMGRRQLRFFLFCIAGMGVCLLSAYINTFLAAVCQADALAATAEIAPVVEEMMKLLPLVFYLLVFEPEGD